jgi:DNA-binding MarR family transcriptional regulator
MGERQAGEWLVTEAGRAPGGAVADADERGGAAELGDGAGVAPRLADAVARLRRAMRRAARATVPENPLSVAQLELLTCLGDHPGARPSEVARLLKLAPNTVTTLVTGLDRLGMLRREDNPGDRRAVRLTLTGDGAAALGSWQRTNEGILERAQAGLTAEQRDALRTALPALSRLIAEIDAQAEQPAQAGARAGQVGELPKVTVTDV